LNAAVGRNAFCMHVHCSVFLELLSVVMPVGTLRHSGSQCWVDWTGLILTTWFTSSWQGFGVSMSVCVYTLLSGFLFELLFITQWTGPG